MGKSCLAGLFVARTGVVADGHRKGRSCMILGKNHRHPVRKLVLLERDSKVLGRHTCKACEHETHSGTTQKLHSISPALFNPASGRRTRQRVSSAPTLSPTYTPPRG